MKLKRLEEIIEEGIESHRSAEEIAMWIRTAINDEWYYRRKDKAELIIE